jgi:hypothetical protein
MLLFGNTLQKRSPISLLKPASEQAHALRLPRLSWSWTVLLPSYTYRKLFTSIIRVLLPFVTYLLTLPRMCILKVLDSNLCQGTSCTDWGFPQLSSVLLGIYPDTNSISLRLLSSKPFHIFNPWISLSFDALQRRQRNAREIIHKRLRSACIWIIFMPNQHLIWTIMFSSKDDKSKHVGICIYICIRVGHKAGPCTATFNDLLCFPFQLALY